MFTVRVQILEKNNYIIQHALSLLVLILKLIFLQWSPTEADVFASCSVDGTLRIWDTRNRQGSAISIKAHDADINVISWNRYESV